ncbi:MAG: phage portal protein [Acidobacteriales bacterium]|nr:phage portal protein [Terriglobales bacterium]
MSLPLSILDTAGRAIDRGLAVFAPETAARRMLIRDRQATIDGARSAQRIGAGWGNRYAAGGTSNLDAWTAVSSSDPNSLIGQHLAIITARTQQLVRDFPYFRRAVNALVNLTCGTGIRVEARVLGPDGKADKKTNQKIEDALAFWNEDADAAGKMEFWETQRLAKRQELEGGEFICVLRSLPRPGKYSRFCIQFYEGQRLTDYQVSGAQQGNQIWKGIEYRADTGQVVAYHFTSGATQVSGTMGLSVRVGAADVVHGFEVLRPGQLRGITQFTPCILLANSLQEYMGAEIDGAKMAAKYLGLIESTDPVGSMTARGEYDSTTSKRLEELQNAMFEYLRPGEKVTFPQINRPGGNFQPFVALILRMVAVSTDVPYELLSGDYSGLDFSNLRGSRLDLKRDIQPHQKRLFTQYIRPVRRAAMTALVMEGKLDLPGYMNDPAHYWRCEFIPPPIEAIDKWKEAEGNLAMVKMGADNLQRLAAENGQDISENLALLQDIGDMAKEIEKSTGINVLNGIFSATVPGGMQELLNNAESKTKTKKS